MEGANRRRWGWRETVIVFAVILISIPIVAGFVLQSQYDDAASQDAAEYARYAEQEVGEACRGVAPVELVHCFSDARIKSELKKREYEHEQADLVAQQTGALWTTLMGLAAILGMGLSVVGVYLVWTTFKETRKANELAMDERAPSIHVEAIEYAPVGDKLRATAIVRNFGSSEAINLGTTFLVAFGPYPLPPFPPDLDEPAGSSKIAAGGKRHLNLTHNDSAHEIPLVEAEERALIVGVAVRYEDRFGRQTDDCFWFFATGAKFTQRILSDCDRWTKPADEKVDPNQPRLNGI
jgi:hypothetical protein